MAAPGLPEFGRGTAAGDKAPGKVVRARAAAALNWLRQMDIGEQTGTGPSNVAHSFLALRSQGQGHGSRSRKQRAVRLASSDPV
jgi:hypothetical protein